MKLKLHYTYLIFLFTLGACRKEDSRWDTQLTAPLASGRLGIDDLVPDSLLENQNGNWHLVFDESLTDINIDSLVTIPDTTFVQSYKSPFGSGSITLPAGATIFNIDEDIPLNVNQAQLRFIKIKSGTLEYKVKSFINGYMTSNYSLPGVSLNNNSLQLVANTSPSTGDIPSEVSGLIDLMGYQINLTGESGYETNTISSTAVISVTTGAPSPAIISAQDSVVVELKFIDVKVAYAKGFFGQHTVNLDQQVDFFSSIDIPEGILKLSEASLNFSVTNYIGIDASLDLSFLDILNDESTVLGTLSNSPILNPINISRAMDSNGILTPTYYSVLINQDNSNLPTLIEQLPAQARFNAQLLINPLGNISGSNDFIYTDNPLEANLKLDIPLKIGASNLSLRDTFELSLDETLSLSGALDVYFNNSFPFSAIVNISLIDSLGFDSFSVLQNGNIPPGNINEQYEVVSPVLSIVSIPVTPTIINRIVNKNKLVISITFNTPDFPQTFVLKEDYSIDFNVVGNGILEIRVN